MLIAAVALVGWFALKPAEPPEIVFARAAKQRLESTLATNGKTEPVAWKPVVADRSGRVERVLVERGSRVKEGQPVAILDSGAAESEISSAGSRVAQVKSELAISESGGRSSELSQIDASVARLTIERDAAARESASLERLLKKQAATASELNASRDRVATLDAQIAGEKARRGALVAPVEVEALKARLRDAEVTLKAAKERLEKATLRAMQSGVVYEVGVRAGEWVEAGGAIAKIGDTSRLRVVIYVDEPDLGRVRPGMSVVLSWDAMPGRQWQGEVKSAPVEVVTLGTRQVGEVIMLADNPLNDLPPGANINASIRSQLIENALAIPKAALRRENGGFGVYRLSGEKVEWRAIEVGVSSATFAEVRGGIQEGDAVALPSEAALYGGMPVRPRYK